MFPRVADGPPTVAPVTPGEEDARLGAGGDGVVLHDDVVGRAVQLDSFAVAVLAAGPDVGLCNGRAAAEGSADQVAGDRPRPRRRVHEPESLHLACVDVDVTVRHGIAHDAGRAVVQKQDARRRVACAAARVAVPEMVLPCRWRCRRS